MMNWSSVVDSQSQYPDLYMVMEYISFVIRIAMIIINNECSFYSLLLSLTWSVITTC